VTLMIAVARIMLLDRAPMASAPMAPHRCQLDASAASSSSSEVICSRVGWWEATS
jgi:hypothetical protein